ncbi:MAG TPA: hypothetical protein ENN43_03935 [bacterium]|nr:hypothetical protein [bacterium]
MKKTILTAALLLLGVSLFAVVPITINYQGYLADSGGVPVNGQKNLRFYIYDAPTGGNYKWSETQSGVNISEGIFNVILGTVWPIKHSFHREYYLEIHVDHTGTGSWQVMSPRHTLTSVPYALAAKQVVYDNTLTVAPDGGGTTSTVSRAIDMLMGTGAFALDGPLLPAPSNTTPWVIEVKGGYYHEPGTFGGAGRIVIPGYVTVRGAGYNAVKIRTSSGFQMTGTKSGMEGFTITNTNYTEVINMAACINCYVRDCLIESVQPNPAINMTNAVESEIRGNRIIGYGSGSARGIRIGGINRCDIRDNYIDINNPALPSANTGSYAISDAGSAIINSYITNNTIRYNTSGSGATAGYGIGLSSGGSGRVSSNIFHLGIAPKDIVDMSTYTAPASTAFTPDGVNNQGSSGALLSNF